MRKINIKHILLLIILFTISIPLIQKSVEIFPEAKPLVGVSLNESDTIFSFNGWWEGRFQAKKEKYLNQQFKQRNFIIRLNNQINFLAFKKVSLKDVVVGKENYLFQGNYCNSITGKDYIEFKITEERLRKLKKVQDTLTKLGIHLELDIAPSKSRYYKEYVPKEWLKIENQRTNYETVKQLCLEKGINLFDVNGWFERMKSSKKQSLFSRTGIHWSNYGSVLYADSLIKRIKAQSPTIYVPGLQITDVQLSPNLAPLDHDLGAAMDLLDSIPVDPMPYPSYIWIQDSTRTKVKALFVADSYLWNLYYQGLTVNMFSDLTYNYYNSTIYNDKTPVPLGTVDITKTRQTIEKHKLVIMLLSEPNLQDLGWGFLDTAYKEYFEKKENKRTK